MWFGTLDGLNRYDGHSFEVFRNNPEDSSSIGNNEIFSLIECPENNLWIGTANGIDVYDPELRNFQRYYVPSKEKGTNIVNTLHRAGDSLLLVGTNNGVHLFRFADKQFEVEKFSQFRDKLKGHRVNTILTIGHEIWVGTNSSLFIFDLSTHQFKDQKSSMIPVTNVKKLLLDKDGRIWLLEPDRINGVTPAGEVIFTAGFDKSSGGGRQSITEQGDDIWFSAGGLKVLDKRDFSIREIVHDDTDPTSVSSNLVASLYASEGGMVWVGTPGLGMNQYDPEAQRLSVVGSNEKLIPKFVKAVYTRDDKKLLVSSNRSIEWYDREKRKFYPVKNQYGDQLRDSDFFVELNDVILSGGRNAVYLIHPKGQAIEIKVQGRVWTALEWGDDFYFGASGGVYSVPKTQLFALRNGGRDASSVDITQVASYKVGKINQLLLVNDHLWMISNRGVKIVDGNEIVDFEEFYPEFDLPQLSQNARSAYQRANGDVWLASANNGIILLDLVKGEARQFDERHGLANGNVYGILEDGEGDFWVSTNNGLSRFSLKEERFYNYSNIEGLQSREFNSGAYFQSPSGMMYFGGVNGLNFFRPEDIVVREPPQTTRIHAFLLNHEEILAGKSPLLSRSIEKTDTLRLEYDQNSFEFQFANINFRDAHSNEYQYRLVGFDEDWVDAGNHNAASYTNMAPGSYEFQARAINSIGRVPQQGYASLVVIISEPFWRSVLFRFLVAAMILLLLIVVVFYLRYKNKLLENLVRERTSEIEDQKRLLLERNKELSNSLNELKKTQELLVHSEKMASLGTLAAGLGHEINNPLNFIKGGLGLLGRKLEHKDKETESFIGMIESGVRRITRLVGSVEKLGESRLGEKQPCEIRALIEDALHVFGNQFSDRVVISKDFEAEELYVKGYNGELQQALHQIFSNAEQSIAQQGEIRIETAREGAFAKIQITDSGDGIDVNDRKRIWDPFYTTKEPGKGEGLGLPIAYSVIKNHRGSISLQSRKGEGTSVTIKLPLSLA